MCRTHILVFLLVSSLLVLSFSQGSGRKVLEAFEQEDSTVLSEENSGNSREMMELQDYPGTGPNTNTKGGFPFPPSPQG